MSLLALLVRLHAGWFFALPLVLFEGLGPTRALRVSRQRAAGHRWKLVLWALGWFLATAILSVLTGRPVRPEVGMTGEVTLSGRVLPIGGVKQKLLAAQRAGLTEVFVPARNEPDLDDVPAEIREQLTVRPVGRVTDILDLALEPAAEATSAAA